MANVNTTAGRKDMEVVETSVNRVRLDEGWWGKDIDSYSLHCCANHGDIIKIKVGKEHAAKVTALNDALSDDVTVTVTFSGLKLKAFAMKGKSNSDYPISGVSGSALDFEYKVQNEVDF